jgi:uncharacterized damage-inducible protein DinB
MSDFTNRAEQGVENADAYVAAVLGLLGNREPLPVMTRTPELLAKAISGLSATQLRTQEAAGKWSVAQVLRHLADAEISFAWRFRLILAQHRPPLGGWDQDAWAERFGYADADAAESLRLFTLLRESNVGILSAADEADLQRVGVHPERGEESLERLLRLCAGHDLVHLRQIDRILGTVGG